MGLKLKLSTNDYLKITYKLFFGFAIAGIIMGFWLYGLLTLDVHAGAPKGTPRGNYWNFFALNGETYTVQIFSYFTVQSNFLCGFFLIIAGFMHKKENRCTLLKHGVIQAIAVYISLTFIVYDVLLLPSFLATGGSFSPIMWFRTMWTHTVEPLAFIIYFLFLFENRVKHIGYKRALVRYLGRYAIYLGVYMAFLLIKGYLIKYTNSPNPSGPNFSYPNSVFQYFFLDFSSTTLGLLGYVWFFITAFIIIGFETAFILLYTLITNKRVKLRKPAVKTARPQFTVGNKSITE